jgi:S-formylglutathione hydrolase FrmB
MKRRLTQSLLALLFVLAVVGGALAAVRSEVITHHSAALNQDKTFELFYPPQYNPRKDYPVLYLLHGAGGSYTQWASRGTLAELLDDYQMFVVLPDGDRTSWYVDSPTTASKYESYIIEDLIPYLDRNFPTVKDRKGRAISGLSMGGHGAVTLALKHPDRFASASSLSGILDIVRHPNEWGIAARLGGRDENRALWEANSALNLLDKWRTAQPVALFTSCGVDDFALPENRDFVRKLETLKIPHLYVEHPGAHTMEYWLGHIEEHLVFHTYIFTH